jgi:hypothetical protein
MSIHLYTSDKRAASPIRVHKYWAGPPKLGDKYQRPLGVMMSSKVIFFS